MRNIGKSKISIAMCTYNGEKYIKDQLISILEQTRLPDELIICDDQSTDQTIQIINEFQEKASFLIKLIINKRQLGSTKNFEKAIMNCSGDIIFLADQDDVWDKNKIRQIEQKFLADDKIAMVFSDAEMVDQHLNSLGYSLWSSIPFTKKEQNTFLKSPLEILIRKNIVTGATMAFRTFYKDMIFPIKGNWIHDAWIALILSSIKNVSIEIINQPLILYRQHSNNQLGAKKKNLSEQILDAKKMKTKEINTDYNEIKEAFLLNNLKIKEPVLYSINNKIKHIENRNLLHGYRFKKYLVILKEILLLRYVKYSNGYKSVLKDVFYK